MFKPFAHIPDFEYSQGWDRYALDYEKLLVKDTVYYLTKEMMHQIVFEEISSSRESFRVLDVNCGTGNDFPFFIECGWHITGCDGSKGMLNKAAENYQEYISTGQLELNFGLLEELVENSFPENSFDLIFSVTGGFSYVDDKELSRINKLLKSFLKDNGKIIVAHLNPVCLPEMIYRTMRLMNPFFRIRQKIRVNIKNEDYLMYLRNPGQLRKIYEQDFQHLKFYPLLAITPPYQTRFKPGKRTLERFRNMERKFLKTQWMSWLADQVVVVGEK